MSATSPPLSTAPPSPAFATDDLALCSRSDAGLRKRPHRLTRHPRSGMAKPWAKRAPTRQKTAEPTQNRLVTSDAPAIGPSHFKKALDSTKFERRGKESPSQKPILPLRAKCQKQITASIGKRFLVGLPGACDCRSCALYGVSKRYDDWQLGQCRRWRRHPDLRHDPDGDGRHQPQLLD